MSRKSGLALKKAIIIKLKQEPLSLRKLETKIGTNYMTIRKHCEELEFFGIIQLIKHRANPTNNRPYVTATLTEYGKRF